jgi:quinolinate synthase
MAESAAILSPEKKVLLPASDAGCPMADMLTAEDIRRMRDQYPAAQVVTYINSTAECKAESDYICTSSNAIKVVNSVEASEVIFAPDKNLGSWVAAHTAKKIHLFDGFCPVHAFFPVEDVVRVKADHPDAILMVHPECPVCIRDMADEVLSTGEMIRFASSAKFSKIIVGTEEGMLHALRRVNPDTEFISASDSLYCRNMKKTTLECVLGALESEEPVVEVDNHVAERARQALERMHRSVDRNISVWCKKHD